MWDPTTLTQLHLPSQLPCSSFYTALTALPSLFLIQYEFQHIRSCAQSAEVSGSVATGDNKALLSKCCIYIDPDYSVDGNVVAEGCHGLSETVRRSRVSWPVEEEASVNIELRSITCDTSALVQ